MPAIYRNKEISGAKDLLGVSELLLKTVSLGQILDLVRGVFRVISMTIEGKILSEALTLNLSVQIYSPNRVGVRLAIKLTC